MAGWSMPSSSALRVAQRRAVDADGVAEVAQSTQQRVYHGLIAQEVAPLVIVQVRGNDRRVAVVTFLHELEEDVGLFRFQVEVPQFVDEQNVEAGQTIQQFSGGAVGQRGIHLVEQVLCCLLYTSPSPRDGL